MGGRLDGRTAIVTGGAKGIGRAFCEGLAAEGAFVAVIDVVDGAETVAAITAAHGAGRAFAVTCDVSNEDSVRAMAGAVMGRTGRIDILVNNAALFASLPPVGFADIDVDLWDRVYAINVRGLFLCVKHTVPHMIAAGKGKVININSGVAYKGMPNMLHYASSKGAVTTLTRALSREVGQHGVCVNNIAPGLTLSSSVLEHFDNHAHAKDKAVAGRAIPRQAVPADLVGAMLFLASDDSDFITGQTIAVDGGSVNL